MAFSRLFPLPHLLSFLVQTLFPSSPPPASTSMTTTSPSPTLHATLASFLQQADSAPCSDLDKILKLVGAALAGGGGERAATRERENTARLVDEHLPIIAETCLSLCLLAAERLEDVRRGQRECDRGTVEMLLDLARTSLTELSNAVIRATKSTDAKLKADVCTVLISDKGTRAGAVGRVIRDGPIALHAMDVAFRFAKLIRKCPASQDVQSGPRIWCSSLIGHTNSHRGGPTDELLGAKSQTEFAKAMFKIFLATEYTGTSQQDEDDEIDYIYALPCVGAYITSMPHHVSPGTVRRRKLPAISHVFLGRFSLDCYLGEQQSQELLSIPLWYMDEIAVDGLPQQHSCRIVITLTVAGAAFVRQHTTQMHELIDDGPGIKCTLQFDVTIDDYVTSFDSALDVASIIKTRKAVFSFRQERFSVIMNPIAQGDFAKIATTTPKESPVVVASGSGNAVGTLMRTLHGESSKTAMVTEDEQDNISPAAKAPASKTHQPATANVMMTNEDEEEFELNTTVKQSALSKAAIASTTTPIITPKRRGGGGGGVKTSHKTATENVAEKESEDEVFVETTSVPLSALTRASAKTATAVISPSYISVKSEDFKHTRTGTSVTKLREEVKATRAMVKDDFEFGSRSTGSKSTHPVGDVIALSTSGKRQRGGGGGIDGDKKVEPIPSLKRTRAVTEVNVELKDHTKSNNMATTSSPTPVQPNANDTVVLPAPATQSTITTITTESDTTHKKPAVMNDNEMELATPQGMPAPSKRAKKTFLSLDAIFEPRKTLTFRETSSPEKPTTTTARNSDPTPTKPRRKMVTFAPSPPGRRRVKSTSASTENEIATTNQQEEQISTEYSPTGINVADIISPSCITANFALDDVVCELVEDGVAECERASRSLRRIIQRIDNAQKRRRVGDSLLLQEILAQGDDVVERLNGRALEIQQAREEYHALLVKKRDAKRIESADAKERVRFADKAMMELNGLHVKLSQAREDLDRAIQDKVKRLGNKAEKDRGEIAKLVTKAKKEAKELKEVVI